MGRQHDVMSKSSYYVFKELKTKAGRAGVWLTDSVSCVRPIKLETLLLFAQVKNLNFFTDIRECCDTLC